MLVYGESVHPAKMTHTKMAFMRRDGLMKRRAYMANDDIKAIHDMHETACCMQKARALAPYQLQRHAVLVLPIVERI